MSKPIELLLVATVSLAAGAWIGAQLAAGPRTTVSAAALEPGRPQARSPALATLRAPDEPSGARTGSPLATSRAGVPSDGRRAHAAPARRDADGGAGSIQGSIATVDGAPLTGVELELEPPDDAPRSRERLATTDAGGRFEFAGLPEGTWKIEARHPDHVLQRRTSFPVRVATGATVDFIAHPATRLAVHVTGPEAERARVAYREAGGRNEVRWSSWSPGSPWIPLSAGLWEVCASVDPLEDWPTDRGWKLARLASAPQTVQVGVEPAPGITLELAPVDCLYGVVRFPDGHQAGHSYPRVRIIEPNDGTRADFDSSEDRIQLTGSVDARGRYGFFALPYARWTAAVGLDWSRTLATVQVVDVEGLTRVDFDGLDLEGEGSVLVDAYSPSGDRVTDRVRLGLAHRDPDDEESDHVHHPTRTVLEAGGSLRLVAMPPSAEGAESAGRKSQLVLTARLSGFAPVERPLSGLTGQRIRVDFEPSTELRIALVGERGARATRRCNAWLEGDTSSSWGSYDEAAEAIVMRGLHPGTYTLTMMGRAAHGGGWERYFNGPVDVLEGPNHVEIPMPARSDLLVRCPGVRKDVEASLAGVEDDPTRDRSAWWWSITREAKVDELGQLRFEGVLAGTYRLSVGPRMQLVRVPSGPVDFVGQAPSRFLFRLRRGDSPLRRAGVRSGDVLLAVDGEEVGQDTARERLGALSTQAGGTLRLTLERLGRELHVTLDAADLQEDESFSPHLEPFLGD